VSNILELKNIKHNFKQGGKNLKILRGVDIAVKRGEIVALLGPSGCGKTTLLQIAGLLEEPTSGEVFIEGKKINKKSDNLRTNLRGNKIGFIYQFHHLLSDFTALENLLLPQYILGVNRADANNNALELLETLGLKKRINHFPSELSGGEQQRVAIARSLINKPAVLLADEPTGNLDPETSHNVFEIMLATIRELKIGALMVTHNIELAKAMDRVLELKDGKVFNKNQKSKE